MSAGANLAAEGWMRDAASGIWRHPDAGSIDYSDGDSGEAAVLGALRNVADRTVGSDELRAKIVDWPTEYHLAPERANLLRPLPIRRGDRVLELGAGCGAITRYLGETGALVVAVEGSPRRAEAAALRCSDLANVSVACADLGRFTVKARFDWILMIGVLEYARVYGTGADPVRDYLEHARRLATPKGCLVLAIENQLGLKYFAGCGEDHVGQPFYGVEGRYRARDPVTFGQQALRAQLASAGWAAARFLYPFPDYKLPLDVVHEPALEVAGFNLADLLGRGASRDYSGLALRAFSERLAWRPVAANGLGGALANSFLVLASRADDLPKRFDPGLDRLAWSYSANRRRAHCVETRFLRDGVRVHVEKHDLYALERAQPAAGSKFARTLPSGDYVPGQLLAGAVLHSLARGDSADTVQQQLLPWLDALLSRALPDDAAGAPLLPEDYVDAIPANAVLDRSGEVRFIDLEWRATERVPLTWVVLRGILGIVLSLDDAGAWAGRTARSIAESLLAARNLALGEDALRAAVALDEALLREARFGGGSGEFPLTAERLSRPIAGGLQRLSSALDLAHARLVDAQAAAAEAARLEADVGVLRRMLDEERAAHADHIAVLHQTSAALYGAGEEIAAWREREHETASRLGAEINALRDLLGTEQAMHAANVAKLVDAEARAHVAGEEIAKHAQVHAESVTRLRGEIDELRRMLADEQRMHAENIAKLVDAEARVHVAGEEIAKHARLHAESVTQLRGEIDELRRMLVGEQRMHAANIAKLVDAEARAHATSEEAAGQTQFHAASVARLREEIDVLRGLLADEQRMHAANIAKLIDADARAHRASREAADLREETRSLSSALSRHRAEHEELQRVAAIVADRAIHSDHALGMSGRVIERQNVELRVLRAEAATWAGRAMRLVVRAQSRLLPADTRRGRLARLADRFVESAASEGLGVAVRKVWTRIARQGGDVMPGSLPGLSPQPGAHAFPPELAQWIDLCEPGPEDLERERVEQRRFALRPLVSVILPVFKVPEPVLRATLDSLRAQTYDHWEACVAYADTANEDHWALLEEYAARDARIRVLRLAENGGISANSNAALAMARGEFVALLDHDDTLSASALHAVVAAMQQRPDADFLYTDKDSIDAEGHTRMNALFKPEWSPEVMHSVNYLTHLNVIRRSVVEAAGGWRSETDGAQDWDLFFRVLERSARACRVPGMHYHWRILPTSTSTGLQAKPYAAAAQLRCQQERLQRLGLEADAELHEECGFRIIWRLPPVVRADVIVRAHPGISLRSCLDTLRFADLAHVGRLRILHLPDRREDAEVERDFRAVWGERVVFSTASEASMPEAIHAAIGACKSEICVIVDGRARLMAPSTLTELVGWVHGHPQIAWVAALALAMDERVYEAGRVLGAARSAPLFKGMPLRSWGWFGGPLWYRNVSAARPYAFAARRRDLLAQAPVAGEPVEAWWNRVCVELRRDGRRGLVDPHARVFLDDDPEPDPGPFDPTFAADSCFHPVFCGVSPLRLLP